MRRFLLSLFWLTPLMASPLMAQDNERLQEAIRLAQEGLNDSARATATRVLASTATSDSLYPQVLYTFGMISRDPDERRRHLARIAIEYPFSAWADDALLQLAMLDYASSNPAGSTRQLERLWTDYPDSPLRPVASYWAARAYFDLRKPADACRWVADGLARVGDDVETRNQLTWYQGRCTNPAKRDLPADTAPARAKPDSTAKPAPTPPVRRGFAIQVGAVNTKAAADKLVDDLKAGGFTGYVVTEKGLFKVRVGPYPDRDRALQVLPNVRRAVGGAPFVVQEP